MEGLRITRRSKGKAKIDEPDYFDDPIDVDDEDFADMGLHTVVSSGTKRIRESGRLRKMQKATDAVGTSEVCEPVSVKKMKTTDVGAGSSRTNKKVAVKKNKVCTSKRVPVNRKPTTPKKTSTSHVLQTRSSPKALYNSIATLNPTQKACLEQLGFGNLLEFKVDGIPSKLGLYVVDMFDDEKMELKLVEGSIEITKDLISDMLGIRNEGTDIMAEKVTGNEEMVCSWTEQYGGRKDIKPTEMKLRIRKAKCADMNFKLNCIVLFTSLMGHIKPKGLCDLEILKYISPDTNIASINWCEYVWKCLHSCKKGWKKGQKDNYFRGPLTFPTMAYVDGTKCNSVSVGRKRPPTSVWTYELLSEQETEELNSGGFGFGEIEGPYVEQEDPMPDTVEEYLWKLNKYINSIGKERYGFEKTLAAAEYMFPGERKLAGFFDKYMDAMNCRGDRNNESGNEKNMDQNRAAEAEENVTNNEGARMESVEAMIVEGVQSPGDADSDIGMVEGGMLNADIFASPTYNMGPETQALANEMVDKYSLSGLDAPEYSMGVQTQKEIERSVDEVDAEIERSKHFDTSDIPSFSLGLGLTQEFADLNKQVVTPVATTRVQNFVIETSNPVPLRACPPVTAVGKLKRGEGKRAVPLSEARRSPFYMRVVDIDCSLNAEEKRVTKYLFRMFEDHTDILFKTKSGQQSTRLQMETLGECEYVDNNVLDTWGAVLNYLETYRSKESPFRMFLPTFVVDYKVYNELRSPDGRFGSFMEYVAIALEKDNKWELLKDIDIVFIPVDNHGKQFLFVADLKTSSVFLIDNQKKEKIVMKNNKKKIGKSQNVTLATMLRDDFGRYLLVKKHTKSETMIGSEVEVGDFKWQSNKMETESGIFLMRQMETFMGMGLDKWDCGLARGTRKLKKQLLMLRNKYAAKILMSECNIFKEKFNQKLSGFADGAGAGLKPIKMPLKGN